QDSLDLQLLVEAVDVEVNRQVLVRPRIPGRRVDTVEDAAEVLFAAAQDTVEPESVFGREDLARIGRTHGRDHVAEDDASLQRARPAVELEQVRLVEIGGATRDT